MIAASNKGPRACWIEDDAGVCRRNPRKGKHTCSVHSEQERRAGGVVRRLLARTEDYGGPALDPRTALALHLEASMQGAHGEMDEHPEEVGFISDASPAYGTAPDLQEGPPMDERAVEQWEELLDFYRSLAAPSPTDG